VIETSTPVPVATSGIPEHHMPVELNMRHRKHLESVGHATIPGMLAEGPLEELRAEAHRLAAASPDHAHGIRDLLRRSPLIFTWAHSSLILSLLPPGFIPVRSILFDKVPGANWKVAWHQDLTIAVSERQELPGYGPWSVKEGVVHVQPPVSLLDCMVTLRLHLDDTPAANGALRVIPGSHRQGRHDSAAIARVRRQTPEHICEARAGDLLLMKPLLLHASSPSAAPGHRRVIHIEYAVPDVLPAPLSWAESGSGSRAIA
jgi:hypothetical protein